MTKIGHAAMLEQFHPTDLLDYCAAAEDAGSDAGFMVSEHFHPWTLQQGQSAFAWAFMGALGTRTTLAFGTAVTCPGFRYHPAVIAHTAAILGAKGGMAFPKQDIKNPEDFATMARLVRPEHFTNGCLVASDLSKQTENVQHYVDMGFDEIHLHNVGRNQKEFIEVFGRDVLPALRTRPDKARHEGTHA